MIKINSFYSQQELDRYYDFLLRKKPSIVKTNGKGTAMVTLLNRLPKKNSQKIEIKDVYELLTMDFTKLKRFCDSLATDNKIYKKLIKQHFIPNLASSSENNQMFWNFSFKR